ncbi:MAG: chlorophyll A-B-binding protein [Cyanobacteria bacterium QH_9_48_43]|jgi:hypothetical protein|nr:MAG: chlorophyll A-B-binding protein [Cyanobacteria bacterium QH_7_48_89]PSO59298.1 MAG: chlorophyll A-B-binding protein [Cyanobacteria bacterium QH_2_48_84]PSO60734.1 MAG: chlorophyll A-B-binding protein [Cyanobacteria bacterium QH_10_48_56]PSO72031.1 MAG: chlorophyll A-B-binding protein [Cyanobacteria bacterium QS_1_48_34]PSO72693.1 MAG: chlorophyll A-B-binding protein [Cyanobacteria bacterium QH_3_48_40]PSO78425.1 MAG: chlorophyll A-B-binding protein [Cyanobacteria bacterium QS_4_48_99]
MNSEEQVASEDQSLIPQIEEPAFGWTPYAERINGRFAMIGFVALLSIELITGVDFFTWLGVR